MANLCRWSEAVHKHMTTHYRQQSHRKVELKIVFSLCGMRSLAAVCALSYVSSVVCIFIECRMRTVQRFTDLLDEKLFTMNIFTFFRQLYFRCYAAREIIMYLDTNRAGAEAEGRKGCGGWTRYVLGTFIVKRVMNRPAKCWEIERMPMTCTEHILRSPYTRMSYTFGVMMM